LSPEFAVYEQLLAEAFVIVNDSAMMLACKLLFKMT